MMVRKMHAALAVSILAMTPAAALAQNSTATVADPANTTVAVDPMATNASTVAADPLANDVAMAQTVPPVREDHDFPWGILGLLGLAGLLGLKRRDDHDHRATGTSTIDRRP